ncbi:hypothetical protein [Bradyrhizobium ottawaense]|uniref:hypothetical protein n=1 Tax=Bradyrhizobium ottawaense TaxID=931866 RepID=UPI00383426DC
MIKDRPAQSEEEAREQQLARLLTAMNAVDHFDRYGLEPALKQIEARWAAAQRKKPDRKLVRQYRAAITKVLTLSKKIGPDFFANEIELASWSRFNPDADDGTLLNLIAGHGRKRASVDQVLVERGLDIDHWLKITLDDYRKRDVRTEIVEPFLELMVGREAEANRKEVVCALFDWIGVEKRFRPTDASINDIARKVAARSGSSEPDATQQSEN